jgi:hypothetical protein
MILDFKKRTQRDMKSLLVQLFILISFSFLTSCTKDNGQVINSDIKQVININPGDILKVNLGNFGDEEGASIFKNPVHAKISKTYRQFNSSSIIYEYSPVDKFVGNDTVTLLLNRGSDGASIGVIDTIKICIAVN